MWVVVVLSVAACSAALAAPSPGPAPAPTPSPQKATSARPNQSAFVPSFDEVVVESSLTVRGKSGSGAGGPQRQGRTKLLVVPTPGTPINGTSVSAVQS